MRRLRPTRSEAWRRDTRHYYDDHDTGECGSVGSARDDGGGGGKIERVEAFFLARAYHDGRETEVFSSPWYFSGHKNNEEWLDVCGATEEEARRKAEEFRAWARKDGAGQSAKTAVFDKYNPGVPGWDPYGLWIRKEWQEEADAAYKAAFEAIT